MDRLQKALAAVVRRAAFGFGLKGSYRRNLNKTVRTSDLEADTVTLAAASEVKRRVRTEECLLVVKWTAGPKEGEGGLSAEKEQRRVGCVVQDYPHQSPGTGSSYYKQLTVFRTSQSALETAQPASGARAARRMDASSSGNTTKFP